MKSTPEPMTPGWPDRIFDELKSADIRQVAYVPDAGHDRLIRRCEADGGMHTVSLTTEEEGIAMLSGCWLGGQRGVLLMQSSGVGNCMNMLSLNQECRIPLLSLVTMRGDWGETNPQQIPMGHSTRAALELAGVITYRAQTESDAIAAVRAAINTAFKSYRAVSVLIGQRLIGAKSFEK